MTTLREALKRLLDRSAPQPRQAPDPPRIQFSYTIYWTKMVREWDAERRQAIAQALAAILAQPDFEPNAYERRYRIAGWDDLAHSGESLLALQKVLVAFEGESHA